MLQNIAVGPPAANAIELKSLADRKSEKDFKGSGSGPSFGKTLEDKIASKVTSETKESSSPKILKDREKPEESSGKKAETAIVKSPGKVKKATDREQAIKDFMDSFESEFKIPSTRLVEAMAQLNDSELILSPEETAESVIGQLGLDQGDSSKAQAMYTALLVQLSQTPEVQATAVPEMTFGRGLFKEDAQARILASQERRDTLGMSVDRLNQKFWNQNPDEAAPVETPELTEGLRSVRAPHEGPAIAEKLKELPPHLQGQMKEAMSPALLQALAAKQALASAQNTPRETAEVSELGTDEMMPAVKMETVAKSEMPSPGEILQRTNTSHDQDPTAGDFSEDSSTSFEQNMQKMAKAMESIEADLESVISGSEKPMNSKQSLEGLEGFHTAPIKGDALGMSVPQGLAPLAATGAAAPSNATENEAAVKQLMNQAQYLIKKGGGEMKVEMTPEGMGTVHLKVMLQDGKVNMQMQAETVEAKKVIESSLAELKTSLAAHKLSMENVKVDVVNNVNNETATQNQTNLNQQGQQQRETRQFWNQFNENFGSQDRKESLSGMPSLKSYGKSRDPLQSIESGTPTRKVEGKGSGLNLVA